MSYLSFEKAWNELPKPNQNNAREIIRGWIKRFNWTHSDFWRVKLEKVIGIDIDWTDKDNGEPPAIYEKQLEE